MQGVNARHIKSKSIPDGWMNVNDFAHRLDRTYNTIVVGLKAGKVPTTHMLYWTNPKTNIETLIVSEDAIPIYEKNTRIRKLPVVEANRNQVPQYVRDAGVDSFDDDDSDATDLSTAKRVIEVTKMKREVLSLQIAQNEVINIAHVENLLTNFATSLRQKVMSFLKTFMK